MAGEVSCAEMRKALEESLEFLGEHSKKVVLFHMTTRHGISLDDNGCSSIQEIDSALRVLLGEGASVVMASLNKKLGAAVRK